MKFRVNVFVVEEREEKSWAIVDIEHAVAGDGYYEWSLVTQPSGGQFPSDGLATELNRRADIPVGRRVHLFTDDVGSFVFDAGIP